jgi:serine/threonine protein kinase
LSLLISDIGLCRKADNLDKTKFYGVMPYVTPEMSKGNPYAQAADIYNFAIVLQLENNLLAITHMMNI